jgi:hypothetical protein
MSILYRSQNTRLFTFCYLNNTTMHAQRFILKLLKRLTYPKWVIKTLLNTCLTFLNDFMNMNFWGFKKNWAIARDWLLFPLLFLLPLMLAIIFIFLHGLSSYLGTTTLWTRPLSTQDWTWPWLINDLDFQGQIKNYAWH